MNITLKKDSWHFKIYSKVLSDKAPKSLCPYFWSWVLIILGSPFYLLIGIMQFLSKLFEKKPEPKKSIHDMTVEEIKEETERLIKKDKRNEMVGNIILGFWLVFSLILIVIGVYAGIMKEGWYSFFRMIFSLIGMVTTGYWTVRLIAHYSEKIGNSNVIKVPVAMVKAIYTKTCPIINWR